MEIKLIQTQFIPLSKLEVNKGQVEGIPSNPRRLDDDAFAKLKKSIEERPGMLALRELCVYPHGNKFVVLGGNMRLRAMRELKYKEAPCKVIPEDTPLDELKAFVVVDNSSFGAWDYDALANEWDDLPLQDWGVPAWDSSSDMKLTTEGRESGEGEKEQHQCENREDNTDGMTVENRAFPGAIFALDGHRLMCGDATDPAAYDALLKAAGVEKVDLALTDPPYGIGIVKKDGKIGGYKDAETEIKHARKNGMGRPESCTARVYRPVIGDDTTGTAEKSVKILFDVASAAIIFGGNYFTEFLPPSACWVIWDKMNGDTDFADVELAWTSFNRGARLFRHLWSGAIRAGDHEAEGRTRLHPTQKPVGLLTAIVERLCPDVQTILDPFGGSGSTLIAADRLGKRCLMMELSPEYVDVILARWETFTGKTAQLITPGDKVS